MPTETIEYRCLLISPSDVSEEREELTEVVRLWNAQVGANLRARVELVRWESHSVPDMSVPAQEAINQQIVNSCDIGIGVFWSRLGSPTIDHPSGSVDEIEKLIQKKARVMLYFSDRPIPQLAIDNEQFRRLTDIRKKYHDAGLCATYNTIEELKTKVNLNLTAVLISMLATDRDVVGIVPSVSTATAPTPDIKVKVTTGFIKDMNPLLRGQSPPLYLGVEVQNHSPVTVFITNISLELDSGRALTNMIDFATGEYQKRQELHSGNSYTFYFDPLKLTEHADEIVAATATDAIGRVYRSRDQDVRWMLKLLLDSRKK